jgi:hypothetical protein
MRASLVVALLIAACVVAWGQQAMPRMTAVDPGTCKVGDLLTVTGENLHKANVAKVYLTDGSNDMQMDIADQAETTIKVKVPAKTKTGRFALMLLTTGKDPKLIEQPVKVTVQDASAPAPAPAPAP